MIDAVFESISMTPRQVRARRIIERIDEFEPFADYSKCDSDTLELRRCVYRNLVGVDVELRIHLRERLALVVAGEVDEAFDQSVCYALDQANVRAHANVLEHRGS